MIHVEQIGTCAYHFGACRGRGARVVRRRMESVSKPRGHALKSLDISQTRTEAIVRYNSAALPARLLLDAREEHRLAHERTTAALRDPLTLATDAAALIRASCLLRSQLMDLLGTPTRPRGESIRRRPIDAPGIPTDALEIAPATPPPPPPTP